MHRRIFDFTVKILGGLFAAILVAGLGIESLYYSLMAPHASAHPLTIIILSWVTFGLLFVGMFSACMRSRTGVIISLCAFGSVGAIVLLLEANK